MRLYLQREQHAATVPVCHECRTKHLDGHGDAADFTDMLITFVVVYYLNNDLLFTQTENTVDKNDAYFL